MGSFMGTLLSFVLLLPVILFGADLYLVSALQTRLETRATSVAYTISLQGGVRNALVTELADEGITLTCLTNCTYVSVGQSIKYELLTTYTPIILKKEEMIISVTRTAIVGYL